MALKEAIAEKPPADSRTAAAEPLSENRMGRSSFYLHVSDPSRAWSLFMQVEQVLSALGYSCARGNLQTDPHPSLGFIDSFEVYIKAGRREPELFGTVTIYGDVKGPKPAPRTMKLDPVYPADRAVFLKAAGAAMETLAPRPSGDGSAPGTAVEINDSPEHSFK